MASEDVQKLVETYRLVGEQVRAELTNVSRTGWRALEARGRETGQKLVPDRVEISPGKSGWRFAELIEWVKTRPAYTPPPAPTCTRRVSDSGKGGE